MTTLANIDWQNYVMNEMPAELNALAQAVVSFGALAILAGLSLYGLFVAIRAIMRFFERASVRADFNQWREDRRNFVTGFVPDSESFRPGYRKRRAAEIAARES